MFSVKKAFLCALGVSLTSTNFFKFRYSSPEEQFDSSTCKMIVSKNKYMVNFSKLNLNLLYINYKPSAASQSNSDGSPVI